MLRKAAALPACILLFHILSAFTADFTGPVVSILDDDTLEVLHNNHAERIRLSGIDCPAKGRAYGKRAKQARLSQCLGKKSYMEWGAGLAIAHFLLSPNPHTPGQGIVRMHALKERYPFNTFSWSWSI